MAFFGNGKVDGRMELEKMLSKRKYPKGKVAIRHLVEFFENRLKTMYKDAPETWKKGYAHAVFSGIENYKKSLEYTRMHGNADYEGRRKVVLKTGRGPKVRGPGRKAVKGGIQR